MEEEVAEAAVSVAEEVSSEEDEEERVEVATGGFFTKCALEVGCFLFFADVAFAMCFLALVVGAEDVSTVPVDDISEEEDAFLFVAPVADGFADGFGFGVMPSPTARMVK